MSFSPTLDYVDTSLTKIHHGRSRQEETFKEGTRHSIALLPIPEQAPRLVYRFSQFPEDYLMDRSICEASIVNERKSKGEWWLVKNPID
jgi:hypothetical protein